MPQFPFLRWFEARTYGIQVWPEVAPQYWSGSPDYKPVDNAWHAGRVNDVIALAYPYPYEKTILAATDSGGVWEIYPPNPFFSAGEGLPLSDDWDNPDVRCLALDYPDRRRIWAGCAAAPAYDGRLLETFVDGLSLDPWV